MPHDPPPLSFSRLFNDGEQLRRAMSLVADERVRGWNWPYRPWRKVRPMARQTGFNPEDAWSALKWMRMALWRPLPLVQSDGRSFGLCQPPQMNEALHRIDRALGGGGAAALYSTDGPLCDPDMQRRIVVRSLMDEAIDSSRIEGAVTTRKKALELLRSGEPPKSKSDRMIVNNWRAMRWIKSRVDQPLSIDTLLKLQSILVDGTLDQKDVGRLRTESDQVVIEDERTREVVFTPPPAHGLEGRLAALCRLANSDHSGSDFLHPVIKACILHFMIGYEHPFVDGNGRTARAVFYWSALRSGYRIFEYLVVSELILKAFARYPQAYIDTEDDDGDLTYFVAFKLGVIERSIDRFNEYLAREQSQIEQSLAMLKRHPDLNLRQRLLLEHALRHPKDEYTARSHATTNVVTEMTARTDLEHLVKRKLMTTYKVGKRVHYVPVPDLMKRLTSSPRRSRPK